MTLNMSLKTLLILEAELSTVRADMLDAINSELWAAASAYADHIGVLKARIIIVAQYLGM